MPTFTQENALSVLIIQQLVADWGYDLDIHGGMNVAALCTADCHYLVGGTLHQGHEPITKFYTARNERVAIQQKDGIRTQRHTITNHRMTFTDANNAAATFILVNYSGEGKAPILNLVGPTIVADCRMEFRRDADGEWRISLFDSTPLFIGNDPFLNASVVKK
ncbi:nuclear transport factor 2 family protein [Sphingobium aromaticiconvertens]|uniref:nuclear transport factor 2 family protein n=1 Tax=Sphingobium aromaticiconvertens TaxID=365341 RepID=UPI003019E140